MDPDDSDTRRSTWSFSHLSLQEFFAAVGLIQGPHTDVWELLEGSVKENEIVITFLCGLLGDPRNAYFLKHLGSTDGLLDFCKEFIKKLKGKLKNDAFKMAQFIYETQCADFVDNVPEYIIAPMIYPMEMLALCWVLAQDTCRVTSLDVSGCELDIPLVKQLCEALQHNKTIQTLNLSKNRVFAKEEAGRTLGAALASMKQLCELSVWECDLSQKSLRHVLGGLSRGCPRLTSLDLGGNDVFAKEEAGRTLGAALASMEQLGELNVSSCRLSKKSLPHFLDGLSRGCPRLTSLNLGDNDVFKEKEAGRLLGDALAEMTQIRRLFLYSCRLTDSSFRHVVNGICRGPGCQQLATLSYRGNKLTSAVSEETTRGLLTQRPDLEIEADGCDLSLLNRRRLRNEFGNRFIWF